MKTRFIAILALALVVVFGTASVASAQTTKTHTVQAGETLFSIARANGVTVQAIAIANGIANPNLIFAGQVLIIPGAAAPTQAPASGSTTNYTVVAGDTLFSIALRNHTTVATLVALNGLSNANVIFVGQVLKIPGTTAAAMPTTAPTAAPTMTPTTAPTMTPTTAPTMTPTTAPTMTPTTSGS